MLKTKSIITANIITVILFIMLIFSVFLVPLKIIIAQEETSAILLGGTFSTNWISKLQNPISKSNISSILITTSSKSINGYIKGENIKDSNSQNDLFYYYKSTDVQVDTNGDDIVDSKLYNLVIYANVKTIYAPKICNNLFDELINCESIIFENFNTSKVVDMSSMFTDCTSLITLNFGANFNTSNVEQMSSMFVGCSSLKTLDLTSFSFESIASQNDLSLFLGFSHKMVAELFNLNIETYVNATYDEKIEIFCEALSQMYNSCSYNELTEDEQQNIRLEAISTVNMGSNSIPKIIAPENLNGFSINLTTDYEYKDSTGKVKTTNVLVSGKTHTIPGYVEDVEIDIIFIISIICLNLLLLILLVIVVIKYKRKNNRKQSLKKAKYYINKN